jgi:ABC-type transport system substrate-binding protein
MRFRPTRRSYLVPALGLAGVAVLSACSSSSSSSAATPTLAPTSAASSAASSAAPTAAASGGTASAVSEITANWNTFFNPATSNAKRVQLLQNGSQFSTAISQLSGSPLASGLTSKVDGVTVTSATLAKVKYDLSVSIAGANQNVASGQTGSSVKQDGIWKVGDDVFCGLLTQAKSFGLSVTVPSACNSAG